MPRLTQRWLRDKLDHIAKEFLGGGGYGAVFEAQFLAYLECLVVVRRGDPAEVWTRFREECEAAAPEGEEPVCHSNRISDRQELADTLRAFWQSFDPEVPAQEDPAPGAQEEPEAGSTTEQEPLGLFDLLGDEG